MNKTSSAVFLSYGREKSFETMRFLRMTRNISSYGSLGSNTCISHRDARKLSYEPQWAPDTTCAFKIQQNQSREKICHCIMKYDVLIFFTPPTHPLLSLYPTPLLFNPVIPPPPFLPLCVSLVSSLCRGCIL